MYKRWETTSKYYNVSLDQDLLGDWILFRSWGSRFSRRGGYKVSAVMTKEEGELLIAKIAKTRCFHGYAFVV